MKYLLIPMLIAAALPASCRSPEPRLAHAGGNPASCPQITSVSIVSRIGEEGTADEKRKFARAGRTVTLFAVVKTGEGEERKSYTLAPLRRRKRTVDPAQWPAACPVKVSWQKVEAKVESYNNAYSAPPANISYAETDWKEGWSVAADVHPTLMHDDFSDVSHGLGTMRYKLLVQAGDQSVSSKGLECREGGAVCRAVHTVAYRKDDSYLGYLHELFNLPYIYGSKRIKGGHQSDLLVGSDCADFAVYGKRRQRGRKKFGYTYTGGLYKLSKKRFRVALDSENCYVDKKGKRLEFGNRKRVRPGDLINFDAGHVGVLVEDDGDGYLDTGDLIMHTLFREPEIVSIEDCRWGQVDGKEILRLKE